MNLGSHCKVSLLAAFFFVFLRTFFVCIISKGFQLEEGNSFSWLGCLFNENAGRKACIFLLLNWAILTLQISKYILHAIQVIFEQSLIFIALSIV